MVIAATILTIIVSFLLVVVILLQSSKGDGLSGSLGGGFMAQNVVGVRQAANVLQRATVILGIAFGLLTLFISLQVGAGGTTERSILRENVSSQLPVLEGTGQAQEGEQVPLFPADTSESQ